MTGGKHRPCSQPRFAPSCSSWACESMTTTLLASHNTANDVPTSPITTDTDQPGTRLCSITTAREGSDKKPLLPCMSAIQTRPACSWPCLSLCQAPVSRTRWSLCHSKRYPPCSFSRRYPKWQLAEVSKVMEGQSHSASRTWRNGSLARDAPSSFWSWPMHLLITSTSVVLLGDFSGICWYSSDNHGSTAWALKVTSEK